VGMGNLVEMVSRFRGCLDAGRCRHATSRASSPCYSVMGVAGGTVPWRIVASIQTSPSSTTLNLGMAMGTHYPFTGG
jgi:hypothetical protein